MIAYLTFLKNIINDHGMIFLCVFKGNIKFIVIIFLFKWGRKCKRKRIVIYILV